MASTASSSLKLRKQGTGDNLNTWGSALNSDVIDLIDEAVAQQVTISLTGNHTLTSTNYATNEARHIYIKFTDGGLGSVPTVTAPAIEKWWWVKNAGSTYAITFGVSGGTTVSIPAGRTVAVFSDGTDCEMVDYVALAEAATAADAAAAAASAAAASTSETNASTSETNAAASAAAASTSETNAATSETNAAASYDAFDDRYLGSKASDPSVDNDGDALITGALYWNTTDSEMKVYTGSAWTNASGDASTRVQKSGDTMSGELVMADKLLTRALLKDFGLEVSAIGNVGATRTFDITNANYFTATLDQNSTFTFSNPTASGDACVFYIELTNGGAFTITWPVAVSWDAATAPTLQASGVDVLAFVTTNAGSTWRGFPVWQAA